MPTPSELLLLKLFLLPLSLLLLYIQPLDPPHDVLIRVPNETPCVPVFKLQIHIFLYELLLSRLQKVKPLPLYITNIVAFVCPKEPLVKLFLIYCVEGKIIPRSVYNPKVSTLLTVPYLTR